MIIATATTITNDFEELKNLMKDYPATMEKLNYVEEYHQQDIFMDYLESVYDDKTVDVETLANNIENDYGMETWFYEHKPCELLDVEDLENTEIMEKAFDEGLENKVLDLIKQTYPHLNREEIIEELESADYEQVKENLR